MPDRRTFLLTAAAATTLPLTGCSTEASQDYVDAAAKLREILSETPELVDLVRYASLAPNGHNMQPWVFDLGTQGVRIRPDMTRRTPVVDPDNHHLYVSLGCAADTLLLAAAGRGRPGAMTFDAEDDGYLYIDLGTAPARSNDLFPAIPERQSTRSEYDGRTVPLEDLRALEDAAAIDGVSLTLITDMAKRDQVRDFVIAGNSAQVDDAAFVEELRHAIRFNSEHALQARDGLYVGCSGNPELPRWIGRRMFGLVFTKDSENDKYKTQIDTSPGIAVFTADRADHDHWVRVGRSFQRFALKATALGLRHAHINQPVEVSTVREVFAKWLGAPDMRPDLVIRFGYAPAMPPSLRRSVTEIIDAGA